MEQQQLKSAIESLLFVSSKPLGIKEIAKHLELEPENILTALNELIAEKKENGVIILESNGQYQLATNSQNSSLVKNFLNADLREKLTDATVEVLAIIAYRQPITKAEIESIRGVNSQYSIRHLLMRGMIEKRSLGTDNRSVHYHTTTEFLQHLGISSTTDLPDFTTLVSSIHLPTTPLMATEENAENLQSNPETLIAQAEGHADYQEPTEVNTGLPPKEFDSKPYEKENLESSQVDNNSTPELTNILVVELEEKDNNDENNS